MLEKIKIPHTIALIFMFIAIVAALTWIIPAGQFDTMKNEAGRTIVVADSYHRIESNPQGIFAFLLAPIKGMVAVAEIIAFVFLVGGVFAIIYKTGAVTTFITRITKKLGKNEILIIPILMLLFSMGGAVFGMCEETLPFIILLIPFCFALGYDSIVAVTIAWVGSGLGFSAAMINPFTVQVAQGIAELPPVSGWWYRTICWFVITTTGIIFTMLYARKIKKNPKASPVYESDLKLKKEHPEFDQEETKMTTSHYLVLISFTLGMIMLVVGVMKWGWYIEEIAALFVAIGLVCGIVSRMGINKMAETFAEGAKDMVAAAIIIGFARAILVVASDGHIIDTILYYLSNLASGLPAIVSSWIMFIVQTFINFFVPSGSGQAALTIPIMAPLGDLIGVSRQVTVLAFQFGDGFTNMINPTHGVLLGCLLIAKIPWITWAKWILPLQLLLSLLAFIFLAIAVMIGF
ncbi:MAG: TIGR00366 family protein [Pseudomonadota bacterium]